MSRLTDQPKRNEHWEDLNYDERTDRLAHLVTEMFRENARLRNLVSELEMDLQNHLHDEKGNVYRKVYVGGRDQYATPSAGIGTTGPRTANIHRLNPLNIRAVSDDEDKQEDVNF